MKKNQKLLIGIAVIMTLVVTIIVLIGGKLYLNEKALDKEMLAVVDSKEAEEVYERVIINTDSKAFTDDGIIQSYKIDTKDIRHNPMGGIMVTIYVNDDSALYIKQTLKKDSATGEITGGGGGISSKLDDLLTDRGENSD